MSPREPGPVGHFSGEETDAADAHEGEGEPAHVEDRVADPGADGGGEIRVLRGAEEAEHHAARGELSAGEPGAAQLVLLERDDRRRIAIAEEVAVLLLAQDVDVMGVEVRARVFRDVVHAEEVHLHSHRRAGKKPVVEGGHRLVRPAEPPDAEPRAQPPGRLLENAAGLVPERDHREREEGGIEVAEEDRPGDPERHRLADPQPAMGQLRSDGPRFAMRRHLVLEGRRHRSPSPRPSPFPARVTTTRGEAVFSWVKRHPSPAARTWNRFATGTPNTSA